MIYLVLISSTGFELLIRITAKFFYDLGVSQTPKINILWRSEELIDVLPVVVALFMTGILTKKRIITICTAIYSIVYFVLFLSMKEMPYGNLGGKGTLIPISSVSVRCLMIFGMIILGLYLKIGAKNNGDTFNT